MATSDVVRDMGETLAYLLRAGIPGTIVDPAAIVVATPDDFDAIQGGNRPQISIFLYLVTVNPERRNGPRRLLPDGRTTRPLLPLELHYLITPWAADPRDEARIAGRILQVLYDRAELGPGDLQGDSWSPDDSVQLVMEALSLDEHFRLWDTTSLAYRLSLTYLARVVGIEPTVAEAPSPVVEARFGGDRP